MQGNMLTRIYACMYIQGTMIRESVISSFLIEYLNTVKYLFTSLSLSLSLTHTHTHTLTLTHSLTHSTFELFNSKPNVRE